MFAGLVTAADYRPLDRAWWRRAGWALDHLEAEAAVRVFELKHTLHCGVISYSAAVEAFEKHWDQAVELQDRVRRELFPWVEVEADRRTNINKMSDGWQSIFGKADDPDTEARIRATCDALVARAASGRNRRIGR